MLRLLGTTLVVALAEMVHMSAAIHTDHDRCAIVDLATTDPLRHAVTRLNCERTEPSPFLI